MARRPNSIARKVTSSDVDGVFEMIDRRTFSQHGIYRMTSFGSDIAGFPLLIVQ